MNTKLIALAVAVSPIIITIMFCADAVATTLVMFSLLAVAMMVGIYWGVSDMLEKKKPH